MNKNNAYLWWHTGIIYQIYPRSFQDSNNDGIGDLTGIINRLDYLKWLGADILWLSPIYSSPMADFGYDISDYENIHPAFGTMEDFDRLLKEVHSHDMKLILDLVPNHTSNQHPWFLESCSSKDNPKREWYIWQNARDDGSLPNNWLSVFGGPAWEWDEQTQQYYFHAFLKEQPDLNWRNPEVQEAMLNVMRFWLDKGVDGFRVDVIWHIIKDSEFRDNPPNPDYMEHMSTYDQLLELYSTDQPEVHLIIRRMRELLDSYGERIMIGEIYLPIHKLMTYYGKKNDGAHMPFNFLLLMLPWDPVQISAAINEYENALPEGGWPNWVLGNHDRPRIASRVGIGQARVAAILLLTLRGTPTMYYGDEIGMIDVPIPFNEVQDPQGLNMPEKNLSRDPCRTPMQWNRDENAGFTTARPWLRPDRSYRRVNTDLQKDDPFSMLSLYHKLIALRGREASLTAGSYQQIHTDKQLLVYKREAAGSRSFLIILNFSHRPAYFRPDKLEFTGNVILSASPESEGQHVADEFSIGGDDGAIIELHTYNTNQAH